MPHRAPIVRRAIRAEITAAEALILAERMRALGAWCTYSALTEAANAERERAARAKRQMTADWASV
ncbi:hypothetical protein Q8W71_17760 [Methylobacterium sp. NEAU 140]|uniref:hypothetical protein n=1 Tax=Methylobacterium sp. NEAU 140 TaxID=3064945 RepID=UPI00273566C4|nr:hypothetical protein [Methylobacterium sp. NEAU 140]MDP4024475.1 hypothetical protein [Methylobacterium sp. NEAU 140]